MKVSYPLGIFTASIRWVSLLTQPILPPNSLPCNTVAPLSSLQTLFIIVSSPPNQIIFIFHLGILESALHPVEIRVYFDHSHLFSGWSGRVRLRG